MFKTWPWLAATALIVAMITRLRYFRLVFIILVAFGSVSDAIEPVEHSNTNSIILFIGDGMGDEHRLAAQWLAVGKSGTLVMDQLSTKGWAKTGSAEGRVTDSAAAATAMASGVKTKNGIIGMDADLNRHTTILEKAKRQGKMVGLVTTTQLSHATPAAFAAHISNRDLMTAIAAKLMAAEVNVLLGGGEDEFLPTTKKGCYPEPGERSDGLNLIEDALSSGYTFVCNPVDFSAVDARSTVKLLGLFADEGMTRPFSPTLAEMTQKAIDILSKSSRGFFLMVESGQIDWASHENDAENAILDTIELDKAVKVAVDYATANDNTLIIVTADHETGGMRVGLNPTGSPEEDGPFIMPDGTAFYVNWSTRRHTAPLVPVTSLGPFTGMLAGIYENTRIFDVMSQVFD